jgi:hypothetical protein
MPGGNVDGGDMTMCYSSYGGCKESINTWVINPTTNLPNGLTLDAAGYVYQLAPGTQLGVSQALSTKAGGEVISADAY